MSLETDLTRWLSRELVKDRKDKPIAKISLRHASPGTKGNEVETYDLTERVYSTEEIPTMAEEMISRAQTDADGMGGVQRYTITLYALNEVRAVLRWPFRIRANGDEFDEAGDEAPNGKGLLSQLMRHNEALAKTMVHAVAGVTTVMARRLESSDQLNSQLMQKHVESMKILEEAKSEQHTRDMELLTTEASETRKNQMFEKLSLLVPVLINKLAGQKVLDSQDPTAMMLKSFAESITADQFKKIQSSLGPEQTILLMQILQGSKEAKQLPSGNNGTS
jgi:hypothetical protein